MMNGTRPKSSAGGDRLSKLEDRVLGHVFSFLPANEAARAALLSSRWRDVFAAVHTVSMVEPEPPLQDYDGHFDVDSWNRGPPPDPDQPPPFHCAVSNALLARNRRGGAAPLRALRVGMELDNGPGQFAWGAHSTTVDQWVSYAVQQAAPEGLRLDLRLRRVPLCDRRRPYSLLRQSRSGGQTPDADREHHYYYYYHGMGAAFNEEGTSPPRGSRRRRRRSSSDMGSEPGDGEEEPYPQRRRSISSNEGSYDSDYTGDRALSPRQRSASGSRRSPYDRSPSPSSSSSDDTLFWPSPRGHDEEAASPDHPDRRLVRTVSAAVFSCAALRSLSLGHFRLAPPTKVNLPSLETLLLSHVPDPGRCVEQIIAGSPRLADLTLEACNGVVRLYVPSCARLRRLALRCCHNLAAAALDSSELVAFEYRGAVPSTTFLTLNGGSPKVTYCKIDICGQEVSSEKEATKLRQLLQLFANAKRLHLESARLGSGIDNGVPMNFPAMSGLRHLELRGRLPDDDETAVVAAVSWILGHAPNLQALSLVFHPELHDRWAGCSHIVKFNEEDLLDVHHLKHGQSVLDAPKPSSMIPSCLSSSVREINLVHYQGTRAQRALAMFLLRNAPVMDTLWCEFAEGPLWTQTQLMQEIKGWVMNESANTHFL